MGAPAKLKSVALTMALVASPALAVTITFTGVSGGTGDVSFDGPLAGQGVIITSSGGPTRVGAPPNPPANINGPSLITNTNGNNPHAPTQTRVEFVASTLNNSISLAVWDTESSVSITSYTSAGAPIETVQLTAQNQLLTFSTLGYASYIIITDGGGDGHIWDDLTFLPNPEPQSFVLLGTALLGLGALRKLRLRDSRHKQTK